MHHHTLSTVQHWKS